MCRVLKGKTPKWVKTCECCGSIIIKKDEFCKVCGSSITDSRVSQIKL